MEDARTVQQYIFVPLGSRRHTSGLLSKGTQRLLEVPSDPDIAENTAMVVEFV